MPINTHEQKTKKESTYQGVVQLEAGTGAQHPHHVDNGAKTALQRVAPQPKRFQKPKRAQMTEPQHVPTANKSQGSKEQTTIRDKEHLAPIQPHKRTKSYSPG